MAARRLLLILASLAGLLAAACIQDDGRRWSPSKVIEVSEEEEQRLGFAFDKWARQNLDLIEDPVVMGFINDLGQTIVRTIEPQPFIYRFRVIRDKRLNAFAVPGGYIYFHSETLLASASIDEVAGVMGHEIAHVKARHYKRMVEQNAIPKILTQLAAVGATLATGHPAPMIVGMGVNVAFQLRFSREFEEEADRVGSVFMARGGYDVRGMAHFFQRIVAAEKRPGPQGLPPYLYTHPDVAERIAGVQARAEQLRPVSEPDPALGAAFYEAQRRLAMLEASDRTVWREPQLPDAREGSDHALRLADEQAAREDTEGALAVLGSAEQAAPEDPRLPFRRGEILEAAGRREEAVAAYRRAVELNPTTGLVLYKLGRAYAEIGDRHRAAYYLEQALLNLGGTSAVRKRAEKELERVSFPVLLEAGLSESFDEQPGRERSEFEAGGEVVWWARVAPHYRGERDEITVRWRSPAGVVEHEDAVETHRRPYVAARFRPAAPGRWTLEAALDDHTIDRRPFRITP